MGVTADQSNAVYGLPAETVCGGKTSGYGLSIRRAKRIRGINKRRRKQGRLRAQIVVSERRDGVHDPRRQPGKSRVEQSETGADAAVAIFSKDSLQYSMIEFRRVRHANSWSELIVFRGR